MKKMSKLSGVVAVVAFLVSASWGQVATADLHVAVKDPGGAIIRDATITVTNQATGATRTSTSNVEGEYQFRSLQPGRYEVTVSAPGFAKTIARDVVITVGQLAELPITLQLATVTETVDVNAEAALVETQRTTYATTVDETRIDNLPINGRNYINFALTNSQLARDTAPSIGAAPTSGLNVGGQRARANLVNVDGLDAVDNSTNGIRSTVSQEAVQEFQLITNGYTAEYGRASGGIVNIITKSGTNQFHGSAFGFLRNRNIQATNPFSTIEKPGYTRTQAGFTAGGAIKKDRTFWFLSYELTRRNETGFSNIGADRFGLSADADISRFVSAAIGQPLPAGTVVVPVTPQQKGILDVLPVAPNTVQYAMLVGTSGSVALTGVNPLTHIIGLGDGFFAPTTASFDPLPASYAPLNSIVGNYPIHENTDLWSLRFDHRLNDNQNLTIRGGWSPSYVNGIQVNAQGPQNFGQNAWSRTSEQNYRDWTGTAQHTWTLGTNKVNEFRFQYARRGLLYNYSSAPGGSNVAVNIPGFAFLGREPFSFVKRTEERYQFVDNFTWTVGRHSIKFGGDVNYLPLQADFTVNFGGIYNFGQVDVATGLPGLTPIQAYGAGLPQVFIQGVGNPHDEFSNKVFAGFVQDSWRITNNLTLNYGVRYDVELTPTFPATTSLAQAAQDALGITQGIPRDYNNFAPRVGLAWDPWGDGKTVIRASYGMFYDHPLLGLAFDSDVADGSQAPQIVLFGGRPTSDCSLNAANAFIGRLSCLDPSFTYTANDQRFNPTPGTQSVWTNQNFLPTNGGAPVPLALLPFGFPNAKNFVYGYSNQANLTFERDLGHDFALSLAYNFNGGRHLNRPINTNTTVSEFLVQNWYNAMTDPANIPVNPGDPDPRAPFATNPLLVSLAGVGPNGPYIPPALVSFFRPSGLNPTLAYYQAPQTIAFANQILSAYGLGLPGTPECVNVSTLCVPFSDMPANFSNGSSVYHGLTANLRKRFSNRYEFLASYTWSKAIDDSTDLESPLSPQNSYNPDAERSVSLFDQRHRFVFSGVYQMGKVGAGAMRALFSDWTFAPMVEFASGRPFNIISGFDQNFDLSSGTDRPKTATAGQTDACNNTAVSSEYSPTGYLIPACFADILVTGQMPALNGDLGRNAGVRPMTIFTDLRVSRKFFFTERVSLEGSMDVFNLINRFNVADVNPLWNQAGTPTAAFDPRQFQFGLRLAW